MYASYFFLPLLAICRELEELLVIWKIIPREIKVPFSFIECIEVRLRVQVSCR